MLSQPRCERRYSFHGVGMTVVAPEPILSVVDARLCPMRVDQADPQASDWLRFDFTSRPGGAVERPDGNVRAVYDPTEGEVGYAQDADRLYLAFGDALRADCDPRLGLTRVWAPEPDRELWRLSHPVLTLPLIEQLKRRGLYSLHAAGVARGGRGLVVVGASGSGKTTLALALSRAGFDFLGDDMLFLGFAADRLRVHAFPDEVDITRATAAFFPELSRITACPRRLGWPKWSFRVETVLDAPIAWACQPAALVFPRIADEPTSRLESMPPNAALMEMLPNVLLTESLSCQAHLHALAELAHTTPCYRLWTGRDFDVLPDLLGSLLA